MMKLISILSMISLSAFAAKYQLDTAHTDVGFSIKHLVISTVKGHFTTFSGGFDFDDKAKTVSDINVEIDTKSINTNEADRDKHLRSADFFDVEKFPKMTFVAKPVKYTGNAPKTIPGDLTIHGITKPVTLKVDFKGKVTDPWGNKKAVFSASTKINRQDFGLKWNKNLDAGGVLVGDEVNIEIEGEANEVDGTKK